MSDDRWPLWMTRDTLAAALEVAPGKIGVLVSIGALPQPEKIGDVERFSRNAVDEHIRGCRQSGASRIVSDPSVEGVANAENRASALRPLGEKERA